MALHPKDIDLNGKNLNPVVVLRDIRKLVPENKTEAIKKTDNSKWNPVKIHSSEKFAKNQRKKENREPSNWPGEYEVEKILTHSRDKSNRIWYLIKWKGWSDEYNTYEMVDNLTGCNYKLMKYLETEKPSTETIRKKQMEIKDSLKNHRVYKDLVSYNYRAEDLKKFSDNYFDISNLFNTSDVSELFSLQENLKKEYKYIVRCLISMGQLKDPGLFRRAQNYKITLMLLTLRKKQLNTNANKQKFINSLEKVPVLIENNVDLETFPEDVQYITEMKVGKGIHIPNDPILGCDCQNACSSKSRCCAQMSGSIFAYKRYEKVRLTSKFPIYECNSRCSCPATCPNRTIQRGRKVQLAIYKTTRCGWGVKALENISKGTFICEYIGELITEKEAIARDANYQKKKQSYLFDLDFYQDRKTSYVIDATHYGNLTRFINHSCDPNLLVYPVWIDCLELSMHRLAFFAKKNIKKGKEISFDYGQVQDGSGETSSLKVPCECQTANCRKWIFRLK